MGEHIVRLTNINSNSLDKKIAAMKNRCLYDFYKRAVEVIKAHGAVHNNIIEIKNEKHYLGSAKLKVGVLHKVLNYITSKPPQKKKAIYNYWIYKGTKPSKKGKVQQKLYFIDKSEKVDAATQLFYEVVDLWCGSGGVECEGKAACL